jgi:hypothetical protein
MNCAIKMGKVEKEVRVQSSVVCNVMELRYPFTVNVN